MASKQRLSETQERLREEVERAARRIVGNLGEEPTDYAVLSQCFLSAASRLLAFIYAGDLGMALQIQDAINDAIHEKKEELFAEKKGRWRGGSLAYFFGMRGYKAENTFAILSEESL